MVCELVGILPPQAVECIAPLIPKPKGGYRDICIFSALVRVRLRARRSLCDAWSAAHAESFFVAGTSRSTVDVAWRSAIKSEAAAAAAGECSALIIWDLETYFQSIRHQELLYRGRA